MLKPPKRKNESDSRQGWQQIAGFLGQPLSVVQRWEKSGMPVTREGRHIRASPEELNRWLGRESAGEPVQIATETADLAADLRRGLSYMREHGRVQKQQISSPAAKKGRGGSARPRAKQQNRS
jgi:hypothetical protein